MPSGLGQGVNLLLLLRYQGIKLGYFHRILPLLMFAKTKEVGLILRAVSMEEGFILLNHCMTQCGGLIELGTTFQHLALGPLIS